MKGDSRVDWENLRVDVSASMQAAATAIETADSKACAKGIWKVDSWERELVCETDVQTVVIADDEMAEMMVGKKAAWMVVMLVDS